MEKKPLNVGEDSSFMVLIPRSLGDFCDLSLLPPKDGHFSLSFFISTSHTRFTGTFRENLLALSFSQLRLIRFVQDAHGNETIKNASLSLVPGLLPSISDFYAQCAMHAPYTILRIMSLQQVSCAVHIRRGFSPEVPQRVPTFRIHT